MRAGKCLPVTVTEVVVDLHYPPQMVFKADKPSRPNYFRFRLGPDMAIALGARAKSPGEAMIGEEIELNLLHQGAANMDAYERLIGDAMRGDSTLFSRQDSAEAQWRIVDSILGADTPLYEYDPGTRGPPRVGRYCKKVGWLAESSRHGRSQRSRCRRKSHTEAGVTPMVSHSKRLRRKQYRKSRDR